MTTKAKGYIVNKLQLRSNEAVVYGQQINPKPHLLRHDIKKEKTYSGNITVNTIKRIRRATQILNQISCWKIAFNPTTNKNIDIRLTFITLTVSDSKNVNHDRSYKDLLKPFLQWMQKTKKINHYIWKAELQKRGQIHYHITTNEFIYWKEIKDKWNYLQQKKGYLDSFYQKYNHYNPNSTDVHKVYNDTDISNYLQKYICKSISKKDTINTEVTENKLPELKIKGKVWDCSSSLKGRKLFTVTLSPNHYKNINEMPDDALKDYYHNDHCTIIKFNPKYPSTRLLYGNENNLYHEWQQSILNYKRKKISKKRSKPASRDLNINSQFCGKNFVMIFTHKM